MLHSMSKQVVASALACVASFLAATPARPEEADCRLESGPDRTVARVVDGETLALDDGSEVRLIGALAPHADDVGADDDAWPPAEAARSALSALALGKPVRLGFLGDRRDRHGRWLAQVHVLDSAGDVWLQGALLAAGHARAYAMSGNRPCAEARHAAEQSARRAAIGVWTLPAYRVRHAAERRDLAGFQGTFQVLQGRIHAVTREREVIRLWLGPDRRRDVSVTLRAGDRDLLGRLGGDIETLSGRHIEARGWLDRRRGAFAGPDIDLSAAGELRFLLTP
jgi:endonuclease YncB( thermonuclease family)